MQKHPVPRKVFLPKDDEDGDNEDKTAQVSTLEELEETTPDVFGAASQVLSSPESPLPQNQLMDRKAAAMYDADWFGNVLSHNIIFRNLLFTVKFYVTLHVHVCMKLPHPNVIHEE